MRVGSLFSGIGGLDLGLERAGMIVEWQVEIDEYCQKVLAKHWPAVRRHRDVRSVGAHNLSRVDLICGGFPCQPHSLAGKRGAGADDRDLWPEYRRIIRELRPTWVLAENVPGLLSSDHGRFFGGILGDLAALGYDVEWDHIPASAVGAPHQRDRVWIIAHADRRRAYTEQERRIRWAGRQTGGRPQSAHGRSVAHAGSVTAQPEKIGCETVPPNTGRSAGGASGSGWWAVEPDFCRVADGVPHRLDRLRGLGNSVVPQVAEYIGRMIMEASAHDRHEL